MKEEGRDRLRLLSRSNTSNSSRAADSIGLEYRCCTAVCTGNLSIIIIVGIKSRGLEAAAEL